MKILYLPSGEKQIYQLFDRIIKDEFAQTNHQFQAITDVKNVKKIKRMIHHWEPHIVFTMAGLRTQPELIQWIRNKNIKTAIWMTEDPYYLDVTSPVIHYYNYVFTIDSAAQEHYKNTGHKNIYYVPLGTDPTCYYPEQYVNEPYESDLTMVGYPYENRVRLIKLLLSKTQYKIIVVGRGWTEALANFKNAKKLVIIDGWIPPSEVIHYYNSSKIVLNIHRPVNEKHNKNIMEIKPRSINNRTFDIAACESFQLIDYRPELSFHFNENEEIIAYKDETTFLEKIDDYIHSPSLRHKIAANARKRVLNEHTFTHRINKIINILEADLLIFEK